ncbi:peptidylprolyl isomerase [Planosporangium thailandense]|uniref:Peptidyl-prolyl cis-trans isomerase n=2 Tax=Planosporangium thailandense TaxID=765197 RepID=A0ABX0Y5Y9_9ACTN|nr:peptidylprolyl isomerase [Planosporangium thailandense]NJC72729.1 peptidylprolyl isomerase [Planosporangium thailandense]
MTLRAEAAQRRRRIQSSIGAGLAVLVVLVGVILVVTLTGNGKKKNTTAAAPSASATPTSCTWKPAAQSGQPANPNAKDVGTPPASGEPRFGTQTMAINTNVGAIEVQVDTAHAPCTASSFTYLASKKFFDNTPCHRLTTSGIYVLQCGDPSGTGTGGPTYQFADENLPTDKRPAYPAGTVAMANAGAGTNGSQFFIVYKDTDLPANYTVLGKVTKGLDVVQKVADGGVTPADPSNPGDGAPKTKVTIQSLTMSAPTQS